MSIITEVPTTSYNVVVKGKVVQSNIPSIQLAQTLIFNLTESDRAVATIVPMTQSGQQVLFG